MGNTKNLNSQDVLSGSPSEGFAREILESTKTLSQILIETENRLNEIRNTLLQEYNAHYKSAAFERQDLDDEILNRVNNNRLEAINKLSKAEREAMEKDNALKEAFIKKQSVLASAIINKDNARRTSESLKYEMKNLRAIEKERKRINADLSKATTKEEKDKLKNELNTVTTVYKEQVKKIEDVKEQLKEDFSEEYGGFLGEIGENIASSLTDLKSKADSGDVMAQAELHATEQLVGVIKSFKQMFEGTINKYMDYQAKINVRLQGTNQSWQGILGMTGIESNLSKSLGINPWVKMGEVMDNVVKAVESGIAFNVEQRAFLESISSEIAATFDAFDSNLMRLIRLQQEDSTAARLGLESVVTSFLNATFSDSSYMSQEFDAVSQNLTNAIAQMSTEQGLAFEYQVQKWLGSLYSVGMSADAISNIASALGMLGSGDVSGLASNSAMQNLIVMAASRVGLSYAEMLTEGLSVDDTNKLLASMVSYLQEIAESDNKVVKSQFSQIYGLSTSDLIAAQNIGKTLENITKSTLNYSEALGQLENQMSLSNLFSRVGMGTMLSNLKDNAIYSIGSNLAANPFTYAMWEITGLIEDLTGGIDILSPFVMGSGVNLPTVTELMRTGLIGIGTLGAIGDIISGLGSSIAPSTMLKKLGISSTANNVITRGSGLSRGKKISGEVSISNTIGNSAGEDYYDSVTTSAQDEADSLIEAKKEESGELTINAIHEYLLQVFDPKITDIEIMLASIAGYSIGKDATTWGDFTDSKQNKYYATQISISSSSETSMAKQNSDNITSINNNVKSILDVLNNVFDGSSSLKVSVVSNNLNIGGGTTIGQPY